MFNRHNSQSFDAVLEECVERIAAGDSVASCLTDYPEHVEALRPILEVATQLNTLPSRKLSETADSVIHQQIVGELRRSAVSKSTKQRSLSHLLQLNLNNILEVLKMTKRTIFPLGTAVVMLALLFFAWQYSSGLPQPLAMFQATSAVDSVTPLEQNDPTTDLDSIIEIDQVKSRKYMLKTTLPEAPARVAAYDSVPFLPNTIESIKQFATEMNMVDPDVYIHAEDTLKYNDRNNLDSMWWGVRSKYGQTLYLYFAGGYGGIAPQILYQSNHQPETAEPSTPISPEDAIAVTEKFLNERDLLPSDYQLRVNNTATSFSSYAPHIRSIVEMIPIINDMPLHLGSNATHSSVSVDHAGAIELANFTKLDAIPTGQEIEIISAEEAYDLLKRKRDVVIENRGVDQTDSTIFESPIPTYDIGDEVRVDHSELYFSPETGTLVINPSFFSEPRIKLEGEKVEAFKAFIKDYEWDSPVIFNKQASPIIIGTITGRDADGTYQLNLTDWETQEKKATWVCLSGEITQEGADGMLYVDQGRHNAASHRDITVGLTDLPEQLNVGDVVEVCANAKPIDGQSYAWQQITIPPPDTDFRRAMMAPLQTVDPIDSAEQQNELGASEIPEPIDDDSNKVEAEVKQTMVFNQVELRYLQEKDALRPVWVFNGYREEDGMKLEYVIDAGRYD